MDYQTIKVRFEDPVCFLQFYRPEANNTINYRLIDECREVLERCEDSITIVVLEGLPEVFCFGADFAGIQQQVSGEQPLHNNPEPMYDLWMKLASGPFITISHVRGKANAGGVGFVAASDIVLADSKAQFSLSELLFGLFPACVLPFLIRRSVRNRRLWRPTGRYFPTPAIWREFAGLWRRDNFLGINSRLRKMVLFKNKTNPTKVRGVGLVFCCFAPVRPVSKNRYWR
jgi:enoyl-CoA hydratase/carnithine racemase